LGAENGEEGRKGVRNEWHSASCYTFCSKRLCAWRRGSVKNLWGLGRRLFARGRKRGHSGFSLPIQPTSPIPSTDTPSADDRLPLLSDDFRHFSTRFRTIPDRPSRPRPSGSAWSRRPAPSVARRSRATVETDLSQLTANSDHLIGPSRRRCEIHLKWPDAFAQRTGHRFFGAYRFSVTGNKQPRPEAGVLGRPPRGGRSHGVAPVGGGEARRSLRRHQAPVPHGHRDRRHDPSTLSHQERGRPRKKARRIAGSSSGHTARGRGFRT
jgi:hypothetical protein